jgi:hypothetical protein
MENWPEEGPNLWEAERMPQKDNIEQDELKYLEY